MAITTPKNFSAAHRKDWGAIDIAKPLKILKRLEAAVEQIEEFGDDGILPAKHTSFSKTHDYRAAKAKADAALKAAMSQLTPTSSGKPRADGHDKRKKPASGGGGGGGGDAAGGGKRSKTVGDIIVTGDMTSKAMCPDHRNNKMTKQPCGQAMRNGATCKWKGRCEFNHTPIDELCSKDQKAWVRKILTTPNLRFNPATVKESIRNMTLDQAAEE